MECVSQLSFVVSDGEPCVRLLDAHSGLPFIVEDLSGAADREERLAELGAEEAQRSFDLETGPLIRSRLIRCRNSLFASVPAWRS